MGAIDRLTILLAALVAVVAVAVGQLVAPPDENRDLRAFPDAEALLTLDGDALDDAAGALEDASGARTAGVGFDRWLRERVLGERIFDDYLLGDDGWMFYRPELQGSCDRAAEQELVARAADRLEDVGAAAGLDVVVIIPPDKAAVHPEHTGRFRDAAACNISHAESLAATEATTGAPVVTGYEAVLALAARADELGPAFFPLDSHWRHIAAAEASREVYRLAAPELLAELELVEVGERTREMDLELLAGRSTAVSEPLWALRPRGAEVVEREGLGDSIEVLRSGGATVPGRAVFMVRDSFGEPMLESLAHLGRSLSVCNCRGALDARSAEPLRDADLLLVQSVQRDAIRHLWTDDAAGQLAAALGGRLDGPALPITGDALRLPEEGLVRFTFDQTPTSVRVARADGTGSAVRLSISDDQVGALFVEDLGAGVDVVVNVTGAALTSAQAVSLGPR